MRQFPVVSALLATCGLMLSLALAPQAAAQGGPAAVGVDAVSTQTVAETVPLFATVVTSREGSVASRIAGTVDKVHVLDGMAVTAGEVLVELDTELLEIIDRQAEARVAEAQAGIATAQSRLDRATNALTRVEGLRDTSAFSQSRFDEAQSDYFEAQGQLAEADARVKTAEAALAEAQYQLARARITAPFSGIVLHVSTNPGEFVNLGAPVLTLLDTQAFEIEASVPAKFIHVLQPGLEVTGVTDNGEELALTVRVLLPVEDQATRTRPVRFASPALAEMAKIAIGQSITVQIPISAPREVLAVPKDALVQGRGGWTVFVAQDGKAEPRTVQIGVALGERFEVLDGLSDGDMVVTRGNERLRPGQEIAPMGAGN